METLAISDPTDPVDAPAAEPAKPSLEEQLRVARREVRAHELLVGPWRRLAQALDLQSVFEAMNQHEDAKKVAARADEAAAELRKRGIDPFTGERLPAAKAEETSA